MPDIEEVSEEEDDEGKPDADGWLDMMSGKIKKRVVKAGSGRNPEMKEDVRCSIDICLASDSSSEPLIRYPEIRYRIGEGEAVPMLELSLRHMNEGEESEVFGMSSMAWGPSGLKAASPKEKDIPPDSNIRMRVKLIEVIPTDNEDIPWNEMIQAITWRKTNGNDHYVRKEFKKAERCYTLGIEIFSHRGFEPPDSVKDADKPAARAAAMSLVTDVGSNLAAVYLEQNNAVKAKETALAALETRPEHMKCLYRAAKACFLLDDFQECEELLKRGFALEQENAALRRLDAELKQKQRKYEAKSKHIAQKQSMMFEDMGYPDLVAERVAQRAKDEYEDTWTYWIKQEVNTWFSKKIIGVVVGFSLLLAVALLILPKRWWPLGMIGYVMGLPATIGVISAKDEDIDEKKKKKSKSKKS